MKYILGEFKERELANALNEKKYKELDNNCKYIVKRIFNFVDDDEIIHAYKIEEFIKPDICIEYKKEKRYISMKSGKSNYIHEEYITNFVKYLKECHISEETINTILLFHYGDGTTDGTGEKRKSFEEIAYELKDKIKLANFELNKSRAFITSTLLHIMFVGNSENAIMADYIYHGDKEYGLIVSRNQIMKYLNTKDFSWLNNIHIGPILLRPKARYVDREIKNPQMRETISFYWPRIELDLKYIENRYTDTMKDK